MILPDGAYMRVALRAVQSLVRTGPALLVVDDLHWLDSASLALWAELAATRSLPAMLIVGTRDVTQSHDADLAQRVISRLHGLPRATRRTLTGLTLSDTAHLLARSGPDDLPMSRVRTIHCRTNGNPYWLNELIASGVTDNAPLPAHLTALVRARLSTVSPTSRHLARMAALLGDSVTISFLQDLSDTDISADIDHLMRVGVFHPVTDSQGLPDTVTFDHALAREALSSSLLPHEAADVHRRALVHAQRHNDAARIVRHAYALGNKSETVQAAVCASREFLQAWLGSSALDMAKIGLEFSPDHPDLLQLAAIAAWDVSDLTAARQYFQQLTAMEISPERRCDAYLRMTGLAWKEGKIEEVWELLSHAQELAQTGSVEQVRWMAAHARARQWMEEYDDLAPFCEQAEAMAMKLDLPQHQKSLAITRAMALHHFGHLPEAVAILEKVWTDSAADGDLRKLPRAINNLLVVQMPVLPETEGRELFARGVAAAGDIGMGLFGGTITRVAVDTEINRGHQSAAIDLLRSRLPLETDPTERVVHTAKLGLLLVESGDLTEAQEFCARSLREAHGMDKHWAVSYPQWLTAAIASRSGGKSAVEKSLRDYRDCNSVSEHRRRDDRVVAVARVALESGYPPELVRRFVSECLEQPIAPGAFGGAGLLRMLLGFYEGDFAQVADFATAHPDWDTGLSAYVRAAGCILMAHAQFHIGDFSAARSHNRLACQLLEQWPGWRQIQAHEQAAALAEKKATLTKREGEVLKRVARGWSNRQVARDLGISQRTVEVHVSRILAKTGTGSRTEAAAWASAS